MDAQLEKKNIAASSSSGAGPSTGRKSCHQCKCVKNPSVGCKNEPEGKKCSLLYCHGCLKKRYGGNEEKEMRLDTWSCPRCRGICDCKECKNKKGGHAVTKRRATKTGEELRSVAGIEMAKELLWKAVDFLNVCSLSGEILGLEEGEPKIILQDLLNHDTKRGGKTSAAVTFHIHLLRIIQEDCGEECSAGGLSNGKSEIPWFDMLKRYLSGSQSVLKAQVRNCIDDQIRQADGKDKDRSLKRKRGHDDSGTDTSRLNELGELMGTSRLDGLAELMDTSKLDELAELALLQCKEQKKARISRASPKEYVPE